MPTRRQEKVAQLVKEVVSEAIQRHLSDPRIQGLISVTEVDVSPNMRVADVYLSILSDKQADVNKTFEAIKAAHGKIKTLLAHSLSSKFCPNLEFHIDEKFKKTMDTIRVIEEIERERREKQANEQDAEEGEDFSNE